MTTPDPRPAADPQEPYPELTEVRISGQSMFQGKLLHVYRDLVRAPDGHEQTFEYTLHPGASVVIPMLDNGQVLLERQWRYALNKSFLEFPAGKLAIGEDPFLAAQRELQEETGYTAKHWASLGVMHPVIGYSTESIYLYAAKGLIPGPAAREQGECMELITMTPAELFEAIRLGQITDSKTLTCALWLDRILRKEWQVDWLSD
jgi:ADP-ribose pyrophosphatase